MKKIAAFLMVCVMVFGIFSVSAGAKTMSKAEIVDFYHSTVAKTAKANKAVLVKNVWKTKDTADFSALSGRDLEKTKKEFDYCTGEWSESFSSDIYLYGVREKGEKVKDTEFYSWFDIEEDLDYMYTLKSAKYADNKITLELVYENDYDETWTGTRKYVAELNSSGYLKKITIKDNETWTEYSVRKGIPFTVNSEYSETYTFVYDKVPVKTLTLSQTEVTLGYGDTAELTYTVGPENATFKGVYVETLAYDEETGEWNEFFGAAYAWEENGKIYIESSEEGDVIVNVYTYSGDIVESCRVVVEFDFFDRVRYFFDNFFWIFEYIFMHSGFYI